jgi:hypothetical protein
MAKEKAAAAPKEKTEKKASKGKSMRTHTSLFLLQVLRSCFAVCDLVPYCVNWESVQFK